MTFKQLLKAKDDALAHADACSEDLGEKSEAYQAATLAFDAANEALKVAHQALHDRLVEKGHHQTIDDHGTVTVYHACDDEPGWKSYHPIPGDE